MTGMTTWIGLLRAINLGPKRKVPMARLKEVMCEFGCTDVKTYIQSGNVVFDHPAKSTVAAEKKLAADLEQVLADEFGFAIPTLLRTTKEWRDVIARCPYEVEEHTKLHVVFLADAVKQDAMAAFDPDQWAPEEWTISKREVFFHLPNGLGRSPLMGKLGRGSVADVGTMRNWRTVEKLADLAGL